jgi:hypothetical protein
VIKACVIVYKVSMVGPSSQDLAQVLSLEIEEGGVVLDL